MTCRFGCGPALAVFAFSDGCVCFPEDREQALCWHHAAKSTPLGTMVLKEDLTVGGTFGKWWAGTT